MTKTEMEIELLPCPFCGSQAASMSFDGRTVVCCGDESDECRAGHLNWEIDKWNTRYAGGQPERLGSAPSDAGLTTPDRQGGALIAEPPAPNSISASVMGEVAQAPSCTDDGLPSSRNLGRNQADANRAFPATEQPEDQYAEYTLPPETFPPSYGELKPHGPEDLVGDEQPGKIFKREMAKRAKERDEILLNAIPSVYDQPVELSVNLEDAAREIAADRFRENGHGELDDARWGEMLDWYLRHKDDPYAFSAHASLPALAFRQAKACAEAWGLKWKN